jgi:outer membrane protein assembly factor BamE (lipoprotein component of BamABCDE complex)
MQHVRGLAMRFLPFYLLALPLTLSVSGCIAQYDHDGFQAAESLRKSPPTVGLSTSGQILEFYGTPTTSSQFGTPTYYYTTQTIRHIGFLPPKVVSQSVFAFSFDAGQRLVSFREYELKHGEPSLVFEKSTTKTHGDDTGVLKDIFGNIGKFNVTNSKAGSGI